MKHTEHAPPEHWCHRTPVWDITACLCLPTGRKKLSGLSSRRPYLTVGGQCYQLGTHKANCAHGQTTTEGSHHRGLSSAAFPEHAWGDHPPCGQWLMAERLVPWWDKIYDAVALQSPGNIRLTKDGFLRLHLCPGPPFPSLPLPSSPLSSPPFPFPF